MISLREYLVTHLFYVVLIAGLALGGTYWLREHDNRLRAEFAIKQSDQQIAALTDTIATRDKATAKHLLTLKQQAGAVTTPAQAVINLPNVSNLPVTTNPALPPSEIAVDAVAFYQNQNVCAQDRVALAACEDDSSNKDAIIKQQAVEITTLKKHPNIFRRVFSRLKNSAIVAGVTVFVVKVVLHV